MDNVKVSVIIPIYNPGESIINSLNSVISQNLKEMEIICINDGSTDNSQNFLEEYAKRDSRLKIIKQENLGAGLARNKGIETAKGEYILFLDSDDWIEENTCELLYYSAKKYDSDLVLFDSLIHNDESIVELEFLNEDFEEKTFNYTQIKNKIFDSYLGVIWNKFYKTKFLKENDIKFPNHKIFNDVEFHIKTMLLAEKITYSNNIFYHYNNTSHFSLQKEHVGSEHSLIFCDVIMGVKEFLNSAQLMDNLKNNFINYSISEFKIKLYHIEENYKSKYFLKIKEIIKSIEFNENDLDDENLIFYKNLINSNTYEEFVENN